MYEYKIANGVKTCVYVRIGLVGVVSQNQEDNIQIVKEIPYCVVFLITYVNVRINRKLRWDLSTPILQNTNKFFSFSFIDDSKYVQNKYDV